MKRIQLKIEKLFVIEVPDDLKVGFEETCFNILEEQIKRNNETPKNIFWDNLEFVCSECGVSLNLDEEKEECMCLQCMHHTFLLMGEKENEI